MLKVGLTGGLGSGKSTASKFFESMGAYILDADESAKNLIDNSKKVQRELIKEFGKPIVSTSANISNNVFPKQFSEISEEIIRNVDYIVNLRQNDIMNKPSSILIIKEDGSIKKVR